MNWSRWYNFDVSLAEVNKGNVDFVTPDCYDLWQTTIPSDSAHISQYNGYSYTTTGATHSYADTVGIMNMYINAGFPKSKLIPSLTGGDSTAAQVAQWVVSNGLGGGEVFTLSSSSTVTAMYNVFGNAPSSGTGTTPAPTPTPTPTPTPITPPAATQPPASTTPPSSGSITVYTQNLITNAIDELGGSLWKAQTFTPASIAKFFSG